VKIGPLDTKKIVVTDFETYFDKDYSLRRKGMRYEQYILDKRFLAHGVAVAYHTGRTDWIDGKDIPKWLRSYRGHTFVNHKMPFDGLIWKLRYNHVAPFMVDTLFLANQVFGPAEISGGNSLEEVAERLGFQAKGKVDLFSGKRILSPEEYQALRIYGTNDADLTFKTFHALLPLVNRPEFELWLIDHTLRIYLTKPLPVVPKIAKAAIQKVEQRVSSHIKELPKITFDYDITKGGGKNKKTVTIKKVVDEDVLASNKQFGVALRHVLKKYKVKVPMKYGKKGMIPALAKTDEGFQALKFNKNKAVSSLITARLTKRSGDTQIARLRTILLTASLGGFRVYLNYWGAGTGRWSGGSGLNAQNMPNPTRSPDEFEREVAALIRAAIVPKKGHVFVAVDAANIEARVLAWWAQQQDLVDAFGDGTDVYSEFASETFGEEVRKPIATDEKVKVIRFKLLRNVGKAAVLGLGYGMGNTPGPNQPYGKFEANLRKSPDVVPLFTSGELDGDKATEIVKQYRSKYTKIVELWSKVESAFLKAREGAQRMVNGVLFTKGVKGGVNVTLPSGRVIHYPRVRMSEYSGKGRPQWVYGHGKGKKLYGSLLVENVVQAMSRDILAEGVWAMEHEGYEVAYHVHDSIVAHVPRKQGKAAMEYCIDVLSTAPEWAPGMRLGAEGAIEEVFA
jgi:hypothetical protein